MANSGGSNKSMVALLAGIGGILMIIGGILGFFLSFWSESYRPNLGTVDLLIIAVLAVIFGIIALMFAGYTHYKGLGEGMGAGLGLIIVGIIAYVVSAAWLLTLIGSILVIIAGAIFVILAVVHGRRTHT